MKLKKRLITAAIAVALVGGGMAATGIATATTPTTTYYACLSTVGGLLYNVNTVGAPKCIGKDTVITWSQTGPAGANGASVVTSSGVPSNPCTIANTDIDLANGEVYTCPSGTWKDSGSSIKGPPGTGATVVTVSPGTNCTYGGLAVTDGNGNVSYVCNGAPGAAGKNGTNGTGATVAPAPSANCPNGGLAVTDGNGNVSYVCNGAPGAAGKNGTGATVVAAPVAECPYGGDQVTDGNGNVSYVCNGAPGAAGTSGGTGCQVTDATNPFTPTATLTDLQTAITAAKSGDTLDVTGECVGNFEVPSEMTLTLMGMPTAVLNGNGSGTVLTVKGADTVILTDLLITGGNDESALVTPGGGIYSQGNLTLNGTSQVSDNYSEWGGGGIGSNGGSITLDGSAQVDNNTSPDDGAGIDLDLGGSLTLGGSAQVDDNTSTGAGGGIFNGGATVTLNDSSQVDDNSADATGDLGGGGGIFNGLNDTTGGTVNLNGSAQVDGNSATNGGYGGGINNGADATVNMNDSSQVDDNSATGGGDGGGIWEESPTVNGAHSLTNVTGNTPDACEPTLC